MLSTACRSLRTARVSRHASPTHARERDGEVVLIDVLVAVQPGVLTSRIDLRDSRACQASLEIPEVGLVHVAVTIEVARNGQRAAGRVDQSPRCRIGALIACIAAATIR